MTNVEGDEEFFSTFSTRNFESFRRERLPVWRRTRTTQEKLISEFYEVTGPTGPARAKGDICVHKEVGVHNGNPLLLYSRTLFPGAL